MTAQIALIVHELMDNPDGWHEKDSETISNGYYTLSVMGSRYGMGTASYQASGAERDILMRALDCWKTETGWQPKTTKSAQETASRGRVALQPDVFIRDGYEKFAQVVRSNLRSFVMHGDANVFSSSIQEAISKLDSILRPMEKIEGKRTDAKDGGISGS